MLGVNIRLGNVPKIIYTTEESLTAQDVGRKVTELTGLSRRDFYIVHNGRLARNSDICESGTADVVPRLFGGKGGFGSMLRAIGAQIEKTTNREACRDLSGRRLRDINEEKRLKSWIDKQATREEEAVERKKKKLERLCAQPKHEFKDKNYENERSTLTEKVGDAVEEGFKLAMAQGSGTKRKNEDNKLKGNRKKLVLDLDIDSDELGSSSDSDSDSGSPSDRKIESSSSSRCSPDNGGIKSSDAGPRDSEESTETPDRDSAKSAVDEADSDPSPTGLREDVDKAAVAL